MSFPRRRFAAGTFVLMIATAWPAPTPTAEGLVLRPVKVEVVNDSLNEPYNQSKNSGAITGTTAQLTFDVPAGQRLIIETITVRLNVLAGEIGEVAVDIPGSSAFLALQSPGSIAGFFEPFTGTYPVKMRVDGSAATDEITFRFTRIEPTGSWFVSASVHGYLVTLPH